MEDKMSKFFLAIFFAAIICASCAASIGPHGASIAIGPPLPVVVELSDPYYYHGGYHYYYDNDRWYYSQSRGGPWRDLPRDRYPREIRYKDEKGGKDWKYDKHKRDKKDWKHDKD